MLPLIWLIFAPQLTPAPAPAPAITSPWLDSALTISASVGWLGLYSLDPQISDAPCRCAPSEVNALDALTFELSWSEGEVWADRVLTLGLALPLLALCASGEGPDEAALLVMESVALTGLMTQAAKLLIARPYPYMYGEGITEGQRRDGVNYASMWSGHTAAPMAAAVTAAALLSRRRSRLARWAWIIGPGLALLSGGLQISAQNHYPSDVLIGALIGAGLGYTNVALRPEPIAATAPRGENPGQITEAP
ncbi:phosphatase PAP2 family protein [Myxococcota bacterium]|nr:phosphatase PAP2 family protein [Myxococcota bacterium]MBU1430695.1 phosphatase PAP2 family protein [Myxococcota bacterium]MBU1900229.1 phosphatase PAP2 family protein [Myxococcota bacterium]